MLLLLPPLPPPPPLVPFLFPSLLRDDFGGGDLGLLLLLPRGLLSLLLFSVFLVLLLLLSLSRLSSAGLLMFLMEAGDGDDS